MRDFLLVAAGGALGACARFGAGQVLPWSGTGFPFATFMVNIAGSTLMGALFALAAGNRALLLLLGVGVLGGFTTFSAFSLETLRLLQRDETTTALAYALGSCILGVTAAWSGFSLARALA